jgi:hypothetical protein
VGWVGVERVWQQPYQKPHIDIGQTGTWGAHNRKQELLKKEEATTQRDRFPDSINLFSLVRINVCKVTWRGIDAYALWIRTSFVLQIENEAGRFCDQCRSMTLTYVSITSLLCVWLYYTSEANINTRVTELHHQLHHHDKLFPGFKEIVVQAPSVAFIVGIHNQRNYWPAVDHDGRPLGLALSIGENAGSRRLFSRDALWATAA